MNEERKLRKFESATEKMVQGSGNKEMNGRGKENDTESGYLKCKQNGVDERLNGVEESREGEET